MQRPGNLVVLLQTRAAAKDLGEPELAHGTLHMANLALRWCRCLDPLGRLPANTAYHIRMGEGLGGSLLRLDVEGRRNGLGDTGVEGRGAAGNDQVAIGLITGPRATFPVTSSGPLEGRVGIQRRRHRGIETDLVLSVGFSGYAILSRVSFSILIYFAGTSFPFTRIERVEWQQRR